MLVKSVSYCLTFHRNKTRRCMHNRSLRVKIKSHHFFVSSKVDSDNVCISQLVSIAHMNEQAVSSDQDIVTSRRFTTLSRCKRGGIR